MAEKKRRCDTHAVPEKRFVLRSHARRVDDGGPFAKGMLVGKPAVENDGADFGSTGLSFGN
jgi:hypothetical protein